ncbi:MAG: O-antigen ligase family protein [Acidobacteriia bacterium]|nr:O-antigen ligase family protein [Terriglobia bacterium]
MLTSKALLPRAEARVESRKPLALATSASVPLSRPAAKETVQDQIQRENPLRKIAFYASLGFLFVRLSAISELLAFYTHINFYLLYLFAPFAILGALTTGGVGRTFRHSAPRYWVAFFGWMILATPFSFWKGDSISMVIGYGRLVLPMLFVLGGLAMTWKEIRLVFYTLALSALANLATVQLFTGHDESGRITLDASGNMGNSNDLGAQLLLVLPFLLFVILDRTKSKALRVSLLPLIAYGAWVVLGTASRGCMIAMAAMFLFALWRATPAQRVATLAMGVVIATAIPLFLPGSVLTRLSSLFSDKRPETVEADESSATREYVLRQSLSYTAQHPLFGVGPGQFPNYEGHESTTEGKRGTWKVTHNFLTQVSSECGVPALIFVLLSLGSALLLVNRTYLQARKKGFKDIANACFCYQLGMVGYVCSIIFLAQAYHFYLPTMIGLAVSMSLVAMRHMSDQEIPSAVSAPSLKFAVR